MKTYQSRQDEILHHARPLFHILRRQHIHHHPPREHIGRMDHRTDVRRPLFPIIPIPRLVQTFHRLDLLEIPKFKDGQLSRELDRRDVGHAQLTSGGDAGYERSGRGQQSAGEHSLRLVVLAESL